MKQSDVDRNIELLKRKDEELSEALEKMENQSENNDIDDVIVPTAPLYKQILNLYAEENAIEDTIFYLGEALRRGVIDLEVFLKVTTSTADTKHHVLKRVFSEAAASVTESSLKVWTVKIVVHNYYRITLINDLRGRTSLCKQSSDRWRLLFDEMIKCNWTLCRLS